MSQGKPAEEMASNIDTSMMFLHRANIERYKRLLTADLSGDDRALIQRQLAREEAALLKLTGQ